MKSTHILIAAVLLAGSVFLMAQETNQTGNLTNIVTQFDSLKEPKITTRPNEKVIVVEARGDPSVIGSKAFGLLFQIYGSIKETPKGPMQIQLELSVEGRSAWSQRRAPMKLPAPGQQ